MCAALAEGVAADGAAADGGAADGGAAAGVGVGDALKTLKAGIDAGSSALDLVEKSVKTFHFLCGPVKDVEDKTSMLEIIVSNLSSTEKLMMDPETWFDCGRFWSQPAKTLHPGHSLTFHVCNSAWRALSGVSGGVAFRVIHKKGHERVVEDAPLFICTFSNKPFYVTKGRCDFTNAGIKSVWDMMADDTIIREPRYGFYRRGDRTFSFIWKDKDVQW